MRMDRFLPSFADEMQKIAVTAALSKFTQKRKGRRPVRVQTVLDKERQEPDRHTVDNEPIEYEAGLGMADGPTG